MGQMVEPSPAATLYADMGPILKGVVCTGQQVINHSPNMAL